MEAVQAQVDRGRRRGGMFVPGLNGMVALPRDRCDPRIENVRELLDFQMTTVRSLYSHVADVGLEERGRRQGQSECR